MHVKYSVISYVKRIKQEKYTMFALIVPPKNSGGQQKVDRPISGTQNWHHLKTVLNGLMSPIQLLVPLSGSI